MKYLGSLAIMALLLVSMVVAKPPTVETDRPESCPEGNGVGSPDCECQEAGFDFGIGKWEYDDGWEVAESDIAPWITYVSGDDEEADWTSNPAVAGVISKEATLSFVHPGGTAGTVYKDDKKGISHLTFCGNDVPTNEVPEFGTIGAIVAVGLAGLLVLRRKKQ